MHTSLKKLASILLILVFALGICGYYPVFRILQYRVRQEVKLRIKKKVPEDQLHTISPESDNELEWLRPDKEFRYKGDLYDIVRTETREGKIIYHCINDKEEKALFATLDELVKKEMDDKSSPQGNTAKNLLKVFFNLYHEVPTSPTAHFQSEPITFQYLFPYTAPVKDLSTPPPESC